MKRAQSQGPVRTGQAFARRTSFAASRFLTPRANIGSFARRAVSDIARGTGVRTDLSGSLANVVDQERIATRISNKAFRPGETGAAGIRQDPKQIQNEARNAAKAVGASTAELLEGLFAFTSQSGDLETARGSMSALAKLARSQGAEMQNVFFAAGKVNNALESQPEFMNDTAKRTKEVFKILNLLTAQTKVGSVEMEKLATQLPKVSGLAGLFEGNTLGSLGKLTTVLQVAEKGQAQNAATAATQTSAFVRELVKGPVAKRFEEAGIETLGKGGKLRDIEEIIKDILTKGAEAEEGGEAKSQTQFLTGLVRNSRAFLPLFDFLDQFQQAGGLKGGAGKERIGELFAKFGKPITEQQLQGDLAAVLDTTEAKAAQFNIQLEELVDKLSVKLLPALERVGPKFLELVEVMGDLTTFMLDNPKQVIGLAISASIARAGIESTLRAGIERAILGPNVAQAGGGVAGSRAGRVGRLASGAGFALTGVAIAATTMTVGMMVIDNLFNKAQEKQREDVRKDLANFNAGNDVRKLVRSGDLQGALAAQQSRLGVNTAQSTELAGRKGLGRTLLDAFAKDQEKTMNALGLGGPEDSATGAIKSRDAAEERQAAALAAERIEIKEGLDAIKTLLANGININNLPEKKDDVDPAGRTSPP